MNYWYRRTLALPEETGDLISLHMGPVDAPMIQDLQIIRSMTPLCLEELIEGEKSNKIPPFPLVAKNCPKRRETSQNAASV